MADKNWVVNFTLPQLSASHHWHSTEVKAANIGLAVNRAWAVIKKKQSVKGRRLEEFRIHGYALKEDK